MKIPDPPITYSNAHPDVKIDLENFLYYFRDDSFIERYPTQLKWFKSKLPKVKSIVNIGCGGGLETYSLLWALKASTAIGLDINNEEIKGAKEIAQFREGFFKRILPGIYDPKDKEACRQWFDDLPKQLIGGPTPEFRKTDISKDMNLNEGPFDLVYFRYVLWTIHKESREKLILTCRNISRLIKPDTGLIVFVEPSRNKDGEYDFISYFEKDKYLSICYVEEDKNKLGCLECSNTEIGNTDPKGFIIRKKAVDYHLNISGTKKARFP